MRKRNSIIIVLCVIAVSVGGYFIFRAQQSPEFDLDQLHLTMSEDDYQILHDFRDLALDQGVLERSDNDYVPATINYLGQEISGKTRLKGDWTDHLGDNKWSFRIKLDKPMKDGLQVFSVQNPQTRDQLNAYVFNQLLIDEGVLTNEYRFIELIVNEKSWGIYCLEEHLTSRLFTKQNRNEGVILKFKDDLYFKYAKETLNTDGLIKYAGIKVYGDEEIAREDEQYIDSAKHYMQDYQMQKAGIYHHFDSTITAKYYALCDLATAYHAMGWINIRFFYNFESQLMEPIGYDAYPILEWGKPYLGRNAYIANNDPYQTEMVVYAALKDSSIYNEYLRTLNRISQSEYVDDFMNRHMKDIQFFEKQIQLEYKDYRYNYNFIKERAQEIREARASD